MKSPVYLDSITDANGLKSEWDEYQRRCSGYDEKRMFLKKQLETVESEFEEARGMFWGHLKKYLDSKGLLEGYSEPSQYLEVNPDALQIFKRYREDGLESFLDKILKK